MKRQLHLLEDHPPVWRLDERTCEVGRRGIAEARQALREAERAERAEHAAERAEHPGRQPAA
jgi:hypothetical protein